MRIAYAACLFGAVAAPGAAGAACFVGAQAVNFGRFNPILEASRDGIGRVTITCDTAQQGTVALSTGLSGSFDRAMTTAGGNLHYNLYTTNARTSVWGDGTAGTNRVAFNGTSVQMIIYGRIQPRSQPTAGTYTDVLIATIEY